MDFQSFIAFLFVVASGLYFVCVSFIPFKCHLSNKLDEGIFFLFYNNVPSSESKIFLQQVSLSEKLSYNTSPTFKIHSQSFGAMMSSFKDGLPNFLHCAWE